MVKDNSKWWKHLFSFSGRASRLEYNLVILCSWIPMIILAIDVYHTHKLLALTGTTDKLDEEMQMDLDIEMTDKFFSDYMKAGEEGFPYRIVEEKGKTRLNIDFPGGTLVLTRDEKK